MQRGYPEGSLGLPKPGKGLVGAMGLILFVWVAFAVGLNYGGLDERAFLLFAGNTQAILHGELWRLVTAGLLHLPTGSAGVSHVLMVLLGLYFLGAPLEARWGARRFVLFLIASTVFGFVTQLFAQALFPAAIGQEYWFGAIGAVEAVAVAWALSSRGQSVYLFFVLPVSATGLLFFVIGVSVLGLIARSYPSEGIVTPFGGMLAGYLFGAGPVPPVKRLWLKLRYGWLSIRAARYRKARPDLRVIEGAGRGDRQKKPDRWLN